MQYQKKYRSPLGEMLLAADDRGLVGIWFRGAEHFGRGLEPGSREGEHPFLSEAERWLDCYFSGHEPEFQPPIHWSGTPFQQTVWELLRQIPYGSTVTYGTLAVYAAERLGRPGMPAQAVGGAVARNPLCFGAVPPGGGGGRQPDRICRRPGAEALAVGAGGRGESLSSSGGPGGSLTGGTVYRGPAGFVSHSLRTNRARMALRMARIITPTSAKMASHILAMPTAPRAIQANLTVRAKAMFW